MDNELFIKHTVIMNGVLIKCVASCFYHNLCLKLKTLDTSIEKFLVYWYHDKKRRIKIMKKNSGELLVELGVINAQQLGECQQEAEKTGGAVEACLVEKKYTTAENLAQAYAKYSSLAYIDTVTDKTADLDLLARVPLKFLRDNEVMPIMVDGTIIILTANPFDFQLLDELNMLLGGGTQYAVAPLPVIINSINRYYPLEGTERMMKELEEEKEAPKSCI
jgi:hypothetical protein